MTCIFSAPRVKPTWISSFPSSCWNFLTITSLPNSICPYVFALLHSIVIKNQLPCFIMAFFAFLGSVFPWKLSQNARHFHDYYQGNVFQSITRIYILIWYFFWRIFQRFALEFSLRRTFCVHDKGTGMLALVCSFFKWQSGGKKKMLKAFSGLCFYHLFLTMTELQGRTLRNFLLPSKHQLSLLISVIVGTLQRWACCGRNKHNSSILVSNDASKTASIALCTNIPIMSTNNTITWGKIPNTIY